MTMAKIFNLLPKNLSPKDKVFEDIDMNVVENMRAKCRVENLLRKERMFTSVFSCSHKFFKSFFFSRVVKTWDMGLSG